MKKNIVIFGGGNGTANTINALKENKNLNLSAVISTSDSGGSSGELRKKFETLPPGDIMRAVLAMSKYDYKILKKIFYKSRFENVGRLDKHNLGNLFLVLSEKYNDDYMSSIRALEQAVDAVGQVYPATLKQNDLVVELSNGDIVRGETNIDRPEYDRSLKIKKAWLEPEVEIYEEVREIIEAADYILLGSGSFFTSIIASILPLGIKKAIEKSKAKLIYICGNAYETHGETGPEILSDFVKKLEEYLPCKLDYIIYNNHELTEDEKKQYLQKKWAVFPADTENLKGHNLIQKDYEANENGGVGLSTKKLGKILNEIIDYGN
ncbi:MAG: uridine diphosphate-N-acetylglucosamine-binding protein YvcK [Candidatus Magasanikbacteria bacterium]|nr:uridine diphosphate-N-acetylglucosamine-binding protein YvcK [Candidatus Magasanikbacteria bacterium]